MRKRVVCRDQTKRRQRRLACVCTPGKPVKPPRRISLWAALGVALVPGLLGNSAAPPSSASTPVVVPDSTGDAGAKTDADAALEITPEMLTEALGELPPELQEELAPPKVNPWDLSVDVRGGVGYNDNVLLGPNHPERSAFWQTGLDLFLFRLPTDGREFSLMVFGEDIRYFSAQNTSQEQLYFGRAQIRRRESGKGSAHLAVEYLYQNQILDASTTEFDLTIVPARGHTVTLEPGWSWSLGKGGELEVELPASRQWYEQPLDSYWEAGPRWGGPANPLPVGPGSRSPTRRSGDPTTPAGRCRRTVFWCPTPGCVTSSREWPGSGDRIGTDTTAGTPP